LSRHLANAGTHHLNRGHQRPRHERGPEELSSKLCACNRICGNAGWVIVGGPSDNARTKRLQQQSHPSRWGKCRHAQVGVCTPPRVGAETSYESPHANLFTIQDDARTNRALKVVQCAQTRVLATYTMSCSEEMDGRYKGQSSFLLQVRYNNGNRIDCSFSAIFARWRGLGILSLARLGRTRDARLTHLDGVH
jgi:hypothetical protein